MNNDVEINDLTTLGDLAIWLHDNGWVASNDAQWARIAPLWGGLSQLRAENARLVAKNEQLVTDLNWIHHAASWLKNNNKNPRAWQCIQDIIDRAEGDK